jgi:N utilization substance protein B
MENKKNNDSSDVIEDPSHDFEGPVDPAQLDEFELEEHEDQLEPLKKRTARALFFHVLYAADIFDFETPVQEIVAGFNREYETDIEVDSYIIPTITAIGERRKELDDHFIPFLKNWRYERIGYCTILILRYAVWEMLYTDTHHNIIINEAIELAKCFAEKDAFKFVNGILDKISKQYQSDHPEKFQKTED